jgi:hypothetical protein
MGIKKTRLVYNSKGKYMEIGDWVRVIHKTQHGHVNRVGQIVGIKNGIVYVHFNDGDFPFTFEDIEPE